MNGYRLLRKTRNWPSTCRSTDDGWMQVSSKRLDHDAAGGELLADRAVGQDHRARDATGSTSSCVGDRDASARGSAAAAPESIEPAASSTPSSRLDALAGHLERGPGVQQDDVAAAGRARRRAPRERSRRFRARRRLQVVESRLAPSPVRPGRDALLGRRRRATSNTVEMPVVVSSSRPSSPRKTFARTPRRASTSAISGSMRSSDTPTTCANGRAGFVSGPRKLKTVGTRSSRRTGAAFPAAGWNTGANMKPMPASARHRCTPPASRSILTPSASSTSAEPQCDDAARLPCLATGTPAPATTIAATVEMLNVLLRSPPVPQVSTTGVARFDGTREAERRRSETLEFVDGLALGAKRHQEAADLPGVPRRS